MRQFRAKSAVLCVLLAAVPAVWAATTSRDQADVLERKVSVIMTPPPGPAGRQTPVTQDELNSWLLFRRDRLPVGVASPQVALLGAGRLSAQAIVDLDVVGQIGRAHV